MTSTKKEQPAAAPVEAPVEQSAPVLNPTVSEHAANLSRADAWKHAAASALHGWGLHAHHAGAEMRLAVDDYLAALKAAEGPRESGKYEPHKPALSPYGGRKR